MLFRFNDFDHPGWLVNDFQQRFERILGELDTASRRSGASWADLEETDEELVVRADLPGLTDADLEITLQNEVLTLTAERTIQAPEGYRAHLRERRPYRFTRSFSLPSMVDGEKVSARLDEGVLTVRMAKAPESRPRQIQVSRG